MSSAYCPSRRDLLKLCTVALPIGPAFAWQQPDVKFSTGVNVVNVLVTVRDKQGLLVKDLTQDDFILEEDGRPQTIGYFSQQSDLPLLLGLLVDTSLSQREVLERERQASYKFLEQVLREEKDKAFVIRFDREVELLQDVTSSRKDLESALHDIQTVPRLNRRDTGTPSSQGGSRIPGGGTALYDAVFLAADEITKPQQGRKAAILMTDGQDSISKKSLTSAIESSQRADTLVFSIYFGSRAVRQISPSIGIGGLGRQRGGGRAPAPLPGANREDGKKVLQRIARETGGGYFEVSNKETIEKIFRSIEDELRNQYSLGYTPGQAGSGYRKIVVSTKRKGLTVRTRDGYYATS